MSIWFYYNEQGEKIQVTGGQLKGLAKAGMITRDTIVETAEGKQAPARRVKGLTFAEAVQPKPIPETILSALKPLPPTPSGINPFTAAMPVAREATAPVDVQGSIDESISASTTSANSPTGLVGKLWWLYGFFLVLPFKVALSFVKLDDLVDLTNKFIVPKKHQENVKNGQDTMQKWFLFALIGSGIIALLFCLLTILLLR